MVKGDNIMGGSQNIQMPLSLFEKIISFFEFANVSNYQFPALYDFGDILADLREKQLRLNLRVAYTCAALEKDDTKRRLAYANYSKLKNKLP